MAPRGVRKAFQLFVLLTFISAACSLSPGAGPAKPPPNSGAAPIRIALRVSTTSDWTTVKLSGATLSHVTVSTVSPETTGGGFISDESRFDLSQPLERANGDPAQLAAEADITKFTGPNVVLTIDRGHIGATQVGIFLVGSPAAGPIASFEWADVKSSDPNAQSFEIPVALFSGQAVAGPEEMRIGVQIDTTSDWTTVNFSGGVLKGTQVKSSSPEATTASFDAAAGQFTLNQPLANAPAKQVQLIAESDLSGLSAPGLTVTIDRGAIGMTRVLIYRLENGRRALVRMMVWSGSNTSDGTFKKSYVIPPEAFTRAQPLELAAGQPLHIRLQISTTSDWTNVKIEGNALSQVQVRSKSSEAAQAEYDATAGQFVLSQPLKRAGRGSVDISADGYLAAQAGSSVTFTISRGDLGATTVQIYVYAGDLAVRRDTLSWGDTNQRNDNAQAFEVPVAVLLGEETAAPASEETIVPDTTKILDSALRSDLQRMDPDGTLHFTRSTPELDALQPGDILASDVTQAAPDGFLKKVVSIRKEGDGLAVQTEDARLIEAVTRAQGSLHLEIGPDVIANAILAPGVTLSADPAPQPGMGGNSNVLASPADLKLTLHYDIDKDFGTNGKLTMQGSVTFQPELFVEGDISCDETRDYGFADICDEIPDLNFMAKVGMEEDTSFAIAGNAGTGFNQEAVLATLPLGTIIIPIGIPVVLRPSLTMFVRADGSISARVGYSMDQHLALGAGFKYNSDHGFEDLSYSNSKFTGVGPTYEGQASVKGTVGLRLQMWIYGIIGPFAALEAGLRMQANTAGLGPPDNALWKAEGCVWLLAGINSVPLLDIEWSKPLAETCTGLGSQSNRPPNVTIDKPAPGKQWKTGVREVHAVVTDLDGNPLTCRWQSSVVSDIFTNGAACSGGDVTVSEPGTHTFTLTATDSVGASDSKSVSVNVIYVPPEPPAAFDVTISVSPGDVIRPDSTVSIGASASKGTPPYSYSWMLQYPTDSDGSPLDPKQWPYLLGADQSFSWTPADLIHFTCRTDALALLSVDVTDATGATVTRTHLLHLFSMC